MPRDVPHTKVWIDKVRARLIDMAIDSEAAMHRLSTHADCTVLIGKKLLQVTFDADRTRLSFEGGEVFDVSGDTEHRIATDILGRAVPDNRALPSLMRLVGMTVRQVGVEPTGLLLSFNDGHEVRVFDTGASTG
jgi:hypothetical protein